MARGVERPRAVARGVRVAGANGFLASPALQRPAWVRGFCRHAFRSDPSAAAALCDRRLFINLAATSLSQLLEQILS
jgi:hypothetical protein